jgi:molybdopterin-binding protein
MKLSIRNVLKGMAVATVKVDVGVGNAITSVVTMDAIKNLGIKVGDEISVLIKATSVMLAKE